MCSAPLIDAVVQEPTRARPRPMVRVSHGLPAERETIHPDRTAGARRAASSKRYRSGQRCGRLPMRANHPVGVGGGPRFCGALGPSLWSSSEQGGAGPLEACWALRLQPSPAGSAGMSSNPSCTAWVYKPLPPTSDGHLGAGPGHARDFRSDPLSQATASVANRPELYSSSRDKKSTK